MFAGLPFPDDRGFVARARRYMPVNAVIASVEFPTDKPFGKRRFPLERLVPFLEPN